MCWNNDQFGQIYLLWNFKVVKIAQIFICSSYQSTVLVEMRLEKYTYFMANKPK